MKYILILSVVLFVSCAKRDNSKCTCTYRNSLNVHSSFTYHEKSKAFPGIRCYDHTVEHNEKVIAEYKQGIENGTVTANLPDSAFIDCSHSWQ